MQRNGSLSKGMRPFGKRAACTFLCMLLFSAVSVRPLFSQTPSQKEQLRIQVWADLDKYPGLFGDEAAPAASEDAAAALTEESAAVAEDVPASGEESAAEKEVATAAGETAPVTAEKGAGDQKTEGRDEEFHEIFDFAIGRMKEVAPYLLEGMLNGWKFEYTPPDKARKVEEYWQMESVTPFDLTGNRIEYRNPVVKEGRLLCWIYCDRNEQQKKNYNYWTSITHPHIHGSGSGPVRDGFDGIRKACSEALKQAVREYWRTMIKNKPKEIDGTVLLIREPRVYIKDGQYVVDLDFFLQTDRIISYSYY